MRTSTLKQLFISTIVGILFALPMSVIAYQQKDMAAAITDFIYFFILLGGTFFVTGILLGKRTRDTTNMRIFATKMAQEGILKKNDMAESPNPGKKETKGWLYLTDSMVIFANTPDPELIEKKAMRLALNKIQKVDIFKPTPITNDGLRITMKNGQNHDFHVGKAKIWKEDIIRQAKEKKNIIRNSDAI